MAIPVPTKLLWAVMSRIGGTPVLQLPPDQIRTASESMKKMRRMPGAALITGKAHPGVRVSEQQVGGADGARLDARIYRPSDAGDETLPLILNFHGGGFVFGDARQSEWWCSSMAYEARAVVVSVDYRLAPEHPFPTPPEDCYAATVWAVEHADELGADGARLAVMGDSAGGNLAAVVSVMSRDRGGPAIGLQVLLYPAVDMLNAYPSEDENEFAPILGKADLGVSDIYCKGREREPYASPLFAEHDGLPAALIQTAQHDPLRDQGAVYADALRAAGVEVRLTNYVDAVHGFISIPKVVPVARQALAEAAASVRSALGRPDTAATTPATASAASPTNDTQMPRAALS